MRGWAVGCEGSVLRSLRQTDRLERERGWRVGCDLDIPGRSCSGGSAEVKFLGLCQFLLRWRRLKGLGEVHDWLGLERSNLLEFLVLLANLLLHAGTVHLAAIGRFEVKLFGVCNGQTIIALFGQQCLLLLLFLHHTMVGLLASLMSHSANKKHV
jgi:hypothetical protein